MKEIEMTYELAHRILHPNTSAEELNKIYYYGGFRDEEERLEVVNKACRKACEAIDKQTPEKPIGKHTSYKCPICGRRVRSGKGSSSRGIDYFCQRCGQALDWSNE